MRAKRVKTPAFPIMTCTVISAVTIAALQLTASPAEACCFGPLRHVLEPGEQLEDSEPPGTVEVIKVKVKRGRAPVRTSLDDLGSIGLIISPPADDRTPVDKMGYRLKHLKGEMPAGLLPDYDVRPSENEIYLCWVDGASNDQEPLDFLISVSAVDLGGNLGLPTSVHVTHPGSTGCGTVGGGFSQPGLVVYLLLLVMATRFGRNSTR